MSEATIPAPAPTADAPAPAVVKSAAPLPEGEPGAPPAQEASPVASETNEPVASPAAGDSETAPVEEAGAASAKTPVDPASYEFKFPDTFTPDEALITTARDVFAKNDIAPEAAQALADLFIELQQASSATAVSQFEAQQRTNLDTIHAMPEFKEGPTRETTLAAIGRLMDTHGSADMKEFIALPQVGNNPAVAAFLAKVAAELSEGTMTPANRPAPQAKGKSPGLFQYPNTPEIQGT